MIETLQAIVGPAHVLHGADCAGYAKDWTGVYPSTPLCVVRPASTAEVSAVVRAVAQAGGAIVPLGGNTGLVGGGQARGEVIVSLERMTLIRALKADARIAIVEAGVILQSLHDAAEAEGLIFPLSFGAKGSARIGGCLSTNAGGSNVVRYGSTRGLCLGLEVVLPSGEVLDMMTELHKDNSGYDLRDLFIGAEGTLGIITGAVVKLFPKPVGYATALLSAPDLGAALTILRALQAASGGAVEAFEYMPRNYMARLAQHRPDLTVPLATGDCTIMVELGGPDMETPLAETLAGLMEDGLVLDATLASSEAQRTTIWAIREASAEIKFNQLPIVDTDVCVPLEKVALFEARVQEGLAALDPGATDITVAHLGDGNFHYAVYPTRDDPAHLDAVRAMVDAVTVSLGGSISAEHGVGLLQMETLKRHKSPVALAVMRQIKRALDPDNVMNPGKVVP
jgi:FAD/FMN-containing dehydrogenase